MTTNDAGDRSLEEFITYAEEVLGVRLTGWQLAVLADVYDGLEGQGYVAKDDREYDKVDDELSDLVDEFLATWPGHGRAKGEPVSLDLGDLTDEVRHALGEAGVHESHGHD